MPTRLNSNKRPNYFTGQLLGEEDFQAEQTYHLAHHRGHNKSLHTPGVIRGLDIDRVDDATVLVRPGVALDSQGCLIFLDTAQHLPLHPGADGSSVFITLSYAEDFQDADRSTDNTQNFTRYTEWCVLQDVPDTVSDSQSGILLGKIQFAGGKITAIDSSVRTFAGARIAPGSIGHTELASGSVTLNKLSADLRSGWVRMAFKPSSFVEPQKEALDFFIGVTKTYCDHRGAKGTMGIPIPMLADRLKTFVIAGERNEADLTIELDRCGWDVASGLHEKTALLQQKIPKQTPFYQSFAINKTLDSASHSLAIYLEASGDASISLIAAEFEYALSK
jgi:hypothetical protein